MIAGLALALLVPAQTADAASAVSTSVTSVSTAISGQLVTPTLLEARRVHHGLYADTWGQWIFFDHYKVARLTWWGVWRLKNSLDNHAPGRGMVASMCTLVGIWGWISGVFCTMYMAMQEWHWGSLLNTAIRRRWCIQMYWRTFGLGYGASSFQRFARCVR